MVAWLVPEIGLRDDRRGRRWLALFRRLEAVSGGAQEVVERVTWEILSALEATRRGSRRRRSAVIAALARQIGPREAESRALELEDAYEQTR